MRKSHLIIAGVLTLVASHAVTLYFCYGKPKSPDGSQIQTASPSAQTNSTAAPIPRSGDSTATTIPNNGSSTNNATQPSTDDPPVTAQDVTELKSQIESLRSVSENAVNELETRQKTLDDHEITDRNDIRTIYAGLADLANRLQKVENKLQKNSNDLEIPSTSFVLPVGPPPPPSNNPPTAASTNTTTAPLPALPAVPVSPPIPTVTNSSPTKPGASKATSTPPSAPLSPNINIK